MSSPTARRALIALAVAGAATLGAVVPATGAEATPGGSSAAGDFVRVIITYDDAATGRASITREVGRTGTVRVALRRSPHLVATVRRSALTALRSAPHVAAVQLDVPERLSLDSSLAVVRADAVHALGLTGSGSTVAVLDSGLDVGHPFVAGRVVAQYCSSSPSDGSERSLCPDGTTEDVAAGVAGLAACAFAGGRLCDHGTHVAGIVAGDGTGVPGAPHAGVAPGAGLIAMQVFTRFDDPADCGGSAPCIASYPSDQLRALDHLAGLATAHPEWNVVAANMSLGGGVSSTACDDDVRAPRIAALHAQGVATVIASGNAGADAGVGRPACISSAVAVGATDDGDDVAWFGNRGRLLDVLAPGVSITSSVPGGWATYDGTSMATPHVAGALAVLRSNDPTRSVSALVSDLLTTGVPVSYPSGAGSRTTPRIDLLAAVRAAGAPPQVVLSSPPASAQEGRAVTARGTWSALDGGRVRLTASSGRVTTTGSRWTWTATRGDDGSVPVTITATDAAGRTGSVGFTARWTNVTPTLQLTATVTGRSRTAVLLGRILDQGWLDRHVLTVTVDGVPARGSSSMRIRPGDPGPVTVSYWTSVRLGSPGTHRVVVTVTDGDGGRRSLARTLTVPGAR